MILFAGLGNPGPKYAHNRHNVGFMAIDAIAAAYGAGPWRSRFQSEVAEVHIDGERILLLKPQTYMNESGRALGEAARFHKIPLLDTVVFYDELDLAPGKVRVKTGGGAAGHNGIRSIDAHIGQGYRRVRIGIDHPGRDQVLKWVLSDFAKVDRVWLDPLLASIAQAAPHLARGDDAGFMTRLALILGDKAKPSTNIKTKIEE